MRCQAGSLDSKFLASCHSIRPRPRPWQPSRQIRTWRPRKGLRCHGGGMRRKAKGRVAAVLEVPGISDRSAPLARLDELSFKYTFHQLGCTIIK